MTTEEGLEFLRQHQPMPSTKLVENHVVARYEDVRSHFSCNPDERCVPLFLNSFGEGDAHGVYQLVGDVMLAHPREVVFRHLKSALLSPHGSVRYWSAQIAAQYPDSNLATELIHLLSDSDSDIRTAAVIALEDVPGAEVTEQLKRMLQVERDEKCKANIGRRGCWAHLKIAVLVNQFEGHTEHQAPLDFSRARKILMNLIEGYIGTRRDANVENKLVRHLCELEEEKRLELLIDYLAHSKTLVDWNRAKLVLALSVRVLERKSSFTSLLESALTESDPSTIQFWVKYVSQRLGFREVVRFFIDVLRRGNSSQIERVGWALYWMKPSFLEGQWYEGAHEDVIALRNAFASD